MDAFLMRLLVLLGVVLGLQGTAFAQVMSIGGTTRLDVTLEQKGLDYSDNGVKIRYTIPYDGMVEIRMYNQNDQLVWRNQFIQKNGDNFIGLRTGSVPGGKYKFKLSYKGVDSFGEMVLQDRPKPQQAKPEEKKPDRKTRQQEAEEMYEGFDFDNFDFE